jgi:phage terminase large subunit
MERSTLNRSRQAYGTIPGWIVGNRIRRFRDDPCSFNDKILRRPPYWKPGQELIARAIVKRKMVLVPTGNSVGKTYALAGIILWWLYTRADSLVICTAPSQMLLGSVLFKEIRRALVAPACPLPGKLTDSPRASPQTLLVDGTGWQVLGIATRGVERLSGQHNPDLLVVVDEASGVEDEIWEALDSQNPAKLLVCGNPLRAEGRFAALHERAQRERDDPSIPTAEKIFEIRIPSTMSPDIDLERSPRGLADRGFLDHARRQYGQGSLWWRTHVLAQFPEVSSETLLPAAWLDWCTRPEHRALIRPGDPRGGKVRMACDLSEGVGRDHTVLLVRDDLGILEVFSSNTAGLPEAAAEIDRLARKWHVAHEHITFDRLGVGKTLPNYLARYGITRAQGYAGEGRPHDKHSFTNLRTEAAWRLRCRLDPTFCPDPRIPGVTQHPFHIPAAPWWPRLRDDLKILTYDLVGKQTRLLPKQEWCQILGRSPDAGDALIQSYAFV